MFQITQTLKSFHCNLFNTLPTNDFVLIKFFRFLFLAFFALKSPEVIHEFYDLTYLGFKQNKSAIVLCRFLFRFQPNY